MCASVLFAGVLGLCVQAVQPLTDAQRTQIDTASDFDARFDDGALYPLLQNALLWQPGDESGAAVPDYQAILKEPATHRGQLFLIEGLFAGRARDIDGLTRPGPWDGKLTEWVVVVNPAKDDVVVVYLVDPPPTPPTSAKVRLPGRFYKVLADKDLNGKPTDYLLFVGRTAATQAGANPPSATTNGMTAAFLVVALLGGGWYVLRRSLQAKPLRSKAHTQRLLQSHSDAPDDDEAIDLPEDPAQALDLLERHHQETE